MLIGEALQNSKDLVSFEFYEQSYYETEMYLFDCEEKRDKTPTYCLRFNLS